MAFQSIIFRWMGFAFFALLSFSFTLVAQTFPNKTIQIIVPFPPGPGVDVVARMIATKMSQSMGQSVVVDNKVGANGAIGSEFVARATPDGYTLLAGTASTHVSPVHLTKNLPYDPVKNFTPITASVELATCLVINVNLPVNNVKELVDYAKKNPKKLSYSSSGIGSVLHLMGELFNQNSGTDLLHVPYKGVAPAMTAVLGAEVDMAFTSLSNALPHAKSGKVKILAVLEPARYAGLPDVPSIRETLSNYQKPATWFGFFGPAGLPPDVLDRLNKEMVNALNAPDIKSKFTEMGFISAPQTPAQFAKLLSTGIDEFGRVVKSSGIKPE